MGDRINTIQRFVTAIERIQGQEYFVSRELEEAVPMSRSYSSAMLPILVSNKLIEVVAFDRPYKYKVLRDFREALDSGELQSIWRSNRNQGADRPPSKHREKHQTAPQEPQGLELNDPIELLEQLTEDDFAQLMSWYFQRQRGEIQPLRDQVKDLQTRLQLIHSDSYVADSKLRQENDTLRRELKDERERIIHLRNELQSANNMLVRKEPPSRVVIVTRKDGDNSRQPLEHGGSGNIKSGYVVHGKPYIGQHVPSAVTNSRNKDQK